MKHAFLMALLAAPILASAQKLPQPSPSAKVEQVIGLTTFKVEYSRPSARGRAIFGELVPYGKVWRTGANKCTTIEFDTPVSFDGQFVKPGKYSLFTIPEQEAWVVILNSNTELWGAGDRKEEEDVLKVKAKVRPAPDMVETFTIGFSLGKRDSGSLDLMWEKYWVQVPIEADCTKEALKNIDEALAKKDAGYGAYNSSARFCLDRGVRQREALGWAERSVSMEKKYWNLHTLALAQAANGLYKEAIGSATESMKLAEKEEDGGYVQLNREKIEGWQRQLAAPDGQRK